MLQFHHLILLMQGRIISQFFGILISHMLKLSCFNAEASITVLKLWFDLPFQAQQMRKCKQSRLQMQFSGLNLKGKSDLATDLGHPGRIGYCLAGTCFFIVFPLHKLQIFEDVFQTESLKWWYFIWQKPGTSLVNLVTRCHRQHIGTLSRELSNFVLKKISYVYPFKFSLLFLAQWEIFLNVQTLFVGS